MLGVTEGLNQLSKYPCGTERSERPFREAPRSSDEKWRTSVQPCYLWVCRDWASKVDEFFQLRVVIISSFSSNSGGDNLRNAIREEDDGLWRHSKLEQPIQ